jgi:malate permease and related proteins
MIINAFLEVLLPIIVVVSCGYALRRRLPIEVRSLNRVSMYVLSPALIFTTLIRMEVSGGQALRISAVSILIIVIMGTLTLALGRVLGMERQALASLLLCTMFMNAGNYGLPTVRFAFGEDGLQRGLLFFIPQTILSQILATAIASAGNGANLRAVLRQILRMPQVYAAFAGLLARMLGVTLTGGPAALDGLLRGVALIADATLPLLLLVLGMQLAQGIELEDTRMTALASGLRLVVSPLVAYGLAVAFALDDPAWRVVMLQAAMPAAVNMSLYALEFDLRPRFVAGVVAITTLISPFSLAVWLSILRV